MGSDKFLGVLLIFVFVDFSVNSRVPVYVWRRQSLENFPPIPALEDIDGKIFKEDFILPLLQQNDTVIVFSQDTFSLEDLSSQNEKGKKIFQNLKESVRKQPSLLLPSVYDPMQKLLLLNSTYKVKEIDLNGDFVQDTVSAIEENDIIFLHLPDSENLADRNKILSQNDNFIKQVQDASSKAKRSITYLYTGYRSSWDELADETRNVRHLLGINDLEPGSTNGLFNFSGCGILYAQNVTANLTKNYTEPVFHGEVYIQPRPCTRDSNSSIKFEMALDMTGITSASLTMEFWILSRRWVLNKTELSINYGEEEDNLILEITEIDVPTDFSFSCWQVAMKLPQNHTLDGNIIFERLQVQPFTTAKNEFASSFDCMPYFTIPIWMGFLVVLLFTVILAVGIYMLFNVQTMDKFDDPKGKTISVPTE